MQATHPRLDQDSGHNPQPPITMTNRATWGAHSRIETERFAWRVSDGLGEAERLSWQAA